jgi:uncharacterized protein
VELGLFGSVLRDDFRSAGDDPSDVDLLVTFEEGYRRSATEWLALEQAVEELFDRKVDLCQKRLLKNPYRRAEIIQTPIDKFTHPRSTTHSQFLPSLVTIANSLALL